MAHSQLDTSLIMIPDVLRTWLFHIHDLLATYHAVMVVFCTMIAYFSFFPTTLAIANFKSYKWIKIE